MSLKLNDLEVFFPTGDRAFPPFSADIKAGEILSLMGPSGCGKSTLLNSISGHLQGEFTIRGSITLNNIDLQSLLPYQRQIGLLFQDDLLFPHLTIWQNIAIGLPKLLKDKVERKQKAYHYLESINLARLAEKYPDQISGGQRARISLIRLLASEPKAILLDEPFSKLDEQLREEFRDWVFAQISERQIPCIMVTHDKADVPCNSLCLQWPWQSHTQNIAP